jgi:hypothetical protein
MPKDTGRVSLKKTVLEYDHYDITIITITIIICGEFATPPAHMDGTRPSVRWLAGNRQVHERYRNKESVFQSPWLHEMIC